MRMTLQRLFALALAMIITLTLAACSDKPKANEPASVLARFEKANNDRDVQALMDCYDPDFVSFTKGILGIVGGVLGAGDATGAMDTLMPYLSKAFQDYVQSNDTYPTIRLKEISTTKNGDSKATIKYTETLVNASGKDVTSTEQTMNVVKVDGVWYISVSFFPNQTTTNPSNIKPYDPNTDVVSQEVVVYSGDDYEIIQRPYMYVDPGYLTSYDNGKTGADKRYGLARKTDTETIQITEAIYDGIGGCDEVLCAVRAYDPMSGESKWGLIDLTGKTVIPMQYDEAWPIDGYVKVAIGKGNNIKWGLLDRTGVEVVPVEFNEVRESTIKDGFVTIVGSDGLLGKYGMINGRIAVPMDYKEISNYSEEMCVAFKYGEDVMVRVKDYYDVNGNIVIHRVAGGLGLNDFNDFHEGFAVVESGGDGDYIYIDKNGNQVGDEFAYAYPFHEGFAVVMPYVYPHVSQAPFGRFQSTDTYGYIDTTGKIVLPSDFIYEFSYPNSIRDASDFENGLAVVNLLGDDMRTNADYYLINRNGEIFKDFKLGAYRLNSRVENDYYESPWQYGVKRIYCDTGEGFNFGFIDGNAWLIASGFVDTGNVSEGLIAVQKQKGSKWGYISAGTGNTAIPYTYDYAGEFSNGIAFARIDDAPDSSLLQILGLKYYPYCLIDTAGTKLSDHNYIGVFSDENGRMSLTQDPVTPFSDNKAIAAVANGDGTYSYVELEIVKK